MRIIKMKINELDFDSHPGGLGGSKAKVKFANGYSASVVTGDMFYSTADSPYEIAVIDSNNEITYDTPITDDVLGYLTEDEANEVLAAIEALPPEGVKLLCKK
jgi:hypothetical protein